MSAPKSRVKQQKLARKRQRKEAARLRRRGKEDTGWSDYDLFTPCFDSGPRGMKMSQVLQDFARPYAEGIRKLAAYRHLLTLAVCAWNAALIEEPERELLVREFIAATFSIFSFIRRAYARRLINTMIARKIECFDSYQSPIAAVDVQDVGDGWYVQVAYGFV